MALRIFGFSLACLGMFSPSLVYAHNFFGDTQPLLNGVAHPFVTLPHVVLLCALVLAFLWQDKLQHGIAGITLGFVVGFCLRAFLGLGGIDLYPLIIGLVLLWGIDVATKKKLAPGVFALSTFVTGGVMGLDTDSEMDSWLFVALFCLGSLVGILALLAYGSFAKRFLKHEWVCIGIRTLGAWLIAVGAMMLAFYLR